jgi:signal transduction histidine kinase
LTSLDKEQARELLRFDNVNKRFEGAKYFVMRGEAIDVAFLKTCLANERVSHVRKTIERAIRQCNNAVQGNPTQAIVEITDLDYERDSSRTIRQVTSVFLHELEPILGLLKHSAAKEIDEYDSSNTKLILNRADRLLKALSELNSATRALPFEEFELSGFVSEIIEEKQKDHSAIRVQVSGNSPCVVKCSPELLELALANGLANAFESIDMCNVEAAQDRGIIVSWGVTEVLCWLVINDEGMGFEEDVNSIFREGATTKNRNQHAGFGLAIIKQVMETLDGEASISSDGLSKGALLRLEWNRRDVS